MSNNWQTSYRGQGKGQGHSYQGQGQGRRCQGQGHQNRPQQTLKPRPGFDDNITEIN